jgi:hypothetical protein
MQLLSSLMAGLALLAVATPPAYAASTYYVSPGGSDASAGTDPGAPLATIQRAVDVAVAGDVIHLETGVYPQDVVTQRDGTADAPITIIGPPDAVVTGAGAARIFEVNHDHHTLEGFTIDGLWGAPGSAAGYRDKLLYALGEAPCDGVTGLRVLGMTFRNAGGECLRLRYFARYNEIASSSFVGCGVYDFVFAGGGKNGEAVYIGTAPEQRADGKNPTVDVDASDFNWVHDNTFDTRGNECVDIKEGASGNLVERNVCTGQRDADSGGFDARGSGNVFRDNESFGNAGTGVRLGGDTAADGIANDVYGNQIHDNQSGGVKFQRLPQGLVCSNAMANNVGGDSVGAFGGQIEPAAPCAGGPPPSGPPPEPPPAVPLCEAAPDPSCRLPVVPGKGLVKLVDRSPDDGDRLVWKWDAGAATAKADFGDPRGVTAYALCAYDGASTRLLAARTSLCPGSTRWRDTSKGYRYRDRTRSPGGLESIDLREGADGSARIVVKGRGAALGPPAPPLPDLPLRVQLRRLDASGICWGASFSAPTRNVSGLFSARQD